MEKMYRLNKDVYAGGNSIHTTVDYNKDKGGYIIRAEIVEQYDGEMSGLFAKAYCKEYFTHGDGIYLAVQAGRRSAKKQAEAEEIFKRDTDMYAEKFLKYVNEKLGTDVCIA